MSNSGLLVRIVLVFLSLGLLTPPLSTAQEREPGEEYGPLLKVLSQSKHSLADGIRQTTKSTEVPISAKFELDNNGKLSLSVYTAEKGSLLMPNTTSLRNSAEAQRRPYGILRWRFSRMRST